MHEVQQKQQQQQLRLQLQIADYIFMSSLIVWSIGRSSNINSILFISATRTSIATCWSCCCISTRTLILYIISVSIRWISRIVCVCLRFVIFVEREWEWELESCLLALCELVVVRLSYYQLVTWRDRSFRFVSSRCVAGVTRGKHDSTRLDSTLDTTYKCNIQKKT